MSFIPRERKAGFTNNDLDKLTCHRRGVFNTTDGIRGKVRFTKVFHLWKMQWSTKERGSHAVVGVATAEAPLLSEDYKSRVGCPLISK